jgi:hypothetical protein
MTWQLFDRQGLDVVSVARPATGPVLSFCIYGRCAELTNDDVRALRLELDRWLRRWKVAP